MPKTVLTPQSPESLRSIASQLEGLASRLRSLGQTMEDEKLSSIDCTHYDAIKKVLDFSHGFELAVRRALTDALLKDGRFKGESAEQPVASKPAKKRK